MRGYCRSVPGRLISLSLFFFFTFLVFCIHIYSIVEYLSLPSEVFFFSPQQLSSGSAGTVLLLLFFWISKTIQPEVIWQAENQTAFTFPSFTGRYSVTVSLLYVYQCVDHQLCMVFSTGHVGQRLTLILVNSLERQKRKTDRVRGGNTLSLWSISSEMSHRRTVSYLHAKDWSFRKCSLNPAPPRNFQMLKWILLSDRHHGMSH